MNVLVTGGAGYLGSTLVPILLSGGHNVRVLDNLTQGGAALLGVWCHPNFEFVLGDLRSIQSVRSALKGMNAVVHLAAIVGDPACARDPELAQSVNLEGSLNLLAECRLAHIKRFLFVSTCSNYGRMQNSNQLVDEDSDLCPISLYAKTKVAFEDALLEFVNKGSIYITILRFATLFGVSSRMRFDLTVNEFTAEIIQNNRLVVYGERFWRPYVHVKDASRAIAIVLAVDEGKIRNQVFNVGDTGQNYQKQTLVELICQYAPEAVIEFVSKEEDPRDYRVSFEKISRELDFRITLTVLDGISEIVHLIQSGVVKDFKEVKYRN